jgi:hypothetical protein
MATNIPKVNADHRGKPRLSEWDFRDEVLRWLLHGNSLLLLRRTCSLENNPLRSLWLQRDTEAKALESLHQMPLEPFLMKVIEVVTAEFLIDTAFALKVITDDQQAMSYRALVYSLFESRVV